MQHIEEGPGTPGKTTGGKVWQALELISPTYAGGVRLSGIGSIKYSASLLNSSGLKSSHIWFSQSSFLAHLIIHHEVLDQSITARRQTPHSPSQARGAEALPRLGCGGRFAVSFLFRWKCSCSRWRVTVWLAARVLT